MAKTLALWRPRGLSGFRQYSDNFRMLTMARPPYGSRTREHYETDTETAILADVVPNARAERPAQWRSRDRVRPSRSAPASGYASAIDQSAGSIHAMPEVTQG